MGYKGERNWGVLIRQQGEIVLVFMEKWEGMGLEIGVLRSTTA